MQKTVYTKCIMRKIVYMGRSSLPKTHLLLKNGEHCCQVKATILLSFTHDPLKVTCMNCVKYFLENEGEIELADNLEEENGVN